MEDYSYYDRYIESLQRVGTPTDDPSFAHSISYLTIPEYYKPIGQVNDRDLYAGATIHDSGGHIHFYGIYCREV